MLEHVHSILHTVRKTEAQTLLRATPRTDPKASSNFSVLLQFFHAMVPPISYETVIWWQKLHSG